MANCFTLRLKRNGELQSLQTVDDEMREFFGAPPSDSEWFMNWYNCEGFGFAVGKTLAELRVIFDTPERKRLHDFLERYTVEAWAER